MRAVLLIALAIAFPIGATFAGEPAVAGTTGARSLP